MNRMMSGARAHILRLAVIAALTVLSPIEADAGPPKSITFTIPGGAIEPAGAMPFEQWISATSSAAITVPPGQQFGSTAILDFCRGTQRNCPSSSDPAALSVPACSQVELPIRHSCTVPVAITPTADSKGVTVRLSIPPLRYNSAYQLRFSMLGKKASPVNPEALQRIDASVEQTIQGFVASKASPTAADICTSLVSAIKSEFKGAEVEESLNACALGTASADQIAAMEGRIADSLNARSTLLEAQANRDPEATIKIARDRVETTQKALHGEIKEVVREVVRENTWMPLSLFTGADAVTTRSAHISADAGLVYGWDMKETTTYMGANIYSRPINRDVSLASLEAEGMLDWRHRLSITLGVTLESIDKAGERKGIIGSNALVVGAGWRLTDVIRLTAGVLVFEEENPNPLVTNDASLTVSPFVGFSFDLDVAKAFGKVFTGLP